MDLPMKKVKDTHQYFDVSVDGKLPKVFCYHHNINFRRLLARFYPFFNDRFNAFPAQTMEGVLFWNSFFCVGFYATKKEVKIIVCFHK